MHEYYNDANIVYNQQKDQLINIEEAIIILSMEIVRDLSP